MVGFVTFMVLFAKVLFRIRKSTGDNRYYAPLDKRETTLMHSIAMSCYVPFSEFYPLPSLINPDCLSRIARPR